MLFQTTELSPQHKQLNIQDCKSKRYATVIANGSDLPPALVHMACMTGSLIAQLAYGI